MEPFNRYRNPFEVKVGVDTLPNFVPEPHYLQVKSLCNEAYLKICTKLPLVYSLNEINAIIDEYEYLFEETEVWIRLYSAFDNFSFLYLEFCELKVLLEAYQNLCINAIDQFETVDKKTWLESHSYLFKYIDERIKIQSNNEFLRIKKSLMMVYKKDAIMLIDFYKIYVSTQIGK